MKRLFIVPIAVFLMAGDGRWLVEPEFPNTEASDFYDFHNLDRDVFYYGKAACEGTCPVYQIYFYANGYLEYVGYQYVEHLGFKTKSLNKEKFQEILKVLETIQFTKLKDKYSNAGNDEVCGDYWYDNPATILALFKNKTVKGVYYSFGCKNFPEEQKLKFAIEKIEQILDVDILTGRD